MVICDWWCADWLTVNGAQDPTTPWTRGPAIWSMLESAKHALAGMCTSHIFVFHRFLQVFWQRVFRPVPRAGENHCVVLNMFEHKLRFLLQTHMFYIILKSTPEFNQKAAERQDTAENSKQTTDIGKRAGNLQEQGSLVQCWSGACRAECARPMYSAKLS